MQSGIPRWLHSLYRLRRGLSSRAPAESSEAKAERPAQDSVERFRTKSLLKSGLTFGLHEFIGMYGIPYTVPVVFSLAFKFRWLFDHNYPSKPFYFVLSENPYFPVQIIFALILVWLLGRVLQTPVHGLGLGTSIVLRPMVAHRIMLCITSFLLAAVWTYISRKYFSFSSGSERPANAK